MSTEPFIGEIKMLGFAFAPSGYSLCQGQTMSIANYTALFSLIGTTYGGDGVNTFVLPNMQSRVSNHMGQGPGLSNYEIGSTAGTETVTLGLANLPMHNHGVGTISAKLPIGTTNADSNAANNYIANATVGMGDFFGDTASNPTVLGAAKVGGNTTMNGSSQPLMILHPYLTVNFSIALEGIFPSRS